MSLFSVTPAENPIEGRSVKFVRPIQVGRVSLNRLGAGAVFLSPLVHHPAHEHEVHTMPLIADCLSASERTFAAGIAADRETQANKRSALIEVTGHYDWKGQSVAPCSRCGRVFVAASLRTVYGPGATALVCRRCKGEHVG